LDIEVMGSLDNCSDDTDEVFIYGSTSLTGVSYDPASRTYSIDYSLVPLGASIMSIDVIDSFGNPIATS